MCTNRYWARFWRDHYCKVVFSGAFWRPCFPYRSLLLSTTVLNDSGEIICCGSVVEVLISMTLWQHWACYLANSVVKWNNIQALVGNHLIALDKCLCVCLIDIGEALQRILGKEVCGIEQFRSCLMNTVIMAGAYCLLMLPMLLIQ